MCKSYVTTLLGLLLFNIQKKIDSFSLKYTVPNTEELIANNRMLAAIGNSLSMMWEYKAGHYIFYGLYATFQLLELVYH